MFQTTNGLDQYAQDRIDYRTRYLSRAFGLGREDEEDVRGDLTLEYLRGMTRFDPELSSKATYTNRILDKAFKSIAKKLRKASERRELRLGAPYLAGEGVPDWRPQVDQRLDVEDALERLARKFRVVAEELKVRSPTEIAERIRVDRSTVYRRVAVIRRQLTDAGLDDAI
jgi:DNA-directed RNA polymerase specialized sigma24 family protein